MALQDVCLLVHLSVCPSGQSITLFTKTKTIRTRSIAQPLSYLSILPMLVLKASVYFVLGRYLSLYLYLSYV